MEREEPGSAGAPLEQTSVSSVLLLLRQVTVLARVPVPQRCPRSNPQGREYGTFTVGRIKAREGTDVVNQPTLKLNGALDDPGGLSVTTKVLKGERGGRRARTKDGIPRKPGHSWL